MGKTEGAEERMAKHVGTMLTPPFSPERAKDLPPWTSRDIFVQGKTWDQSSVDISVAGAMGSCAVCLYGNSRCLYGSWIRQLLMMAMNEFDGIMLCFTWLRSGLDCCGLQGSSGFQALDLLRCCCDHS